MAFDRNRSGKKQWKVFKNDDIRAHKIMLIDSDGTKVGVVPRAEAMARAEQAGMDLVQLAYNPEDRVATAKIVDFGKYMYEKKKTENEKRKQQKGKGQKEIKFGYNIGDHDLELKIKKAAEFLGKGYAVKVMIVLRGREKAYKSLAYEKIMQVEEMLAEYGKSQGIKEEHFGYVLVLLGKR